MAVWSSGRTLVITIMMMSFWSHFSCGQESTTEDIEDIDSGKGDQNCHLTSQSFYSYVVRIWNAEWRNTSAHGSILSIKGILTICSPFIIVGNDNIVRSRPVDPFTVFAQKVRAVDPDWDLDGSKVCSQARKAFQIFPHPKCTTYEERDFVYNFAVIEIDKPFLVFRQHSYPTLNFPNVLSLMVYYVTLVNTRRDPGCEIPLFYYHARQKPVFAHNMNVVSMRYFVECIPRICEFPPYVFTPGAFRYPGHFPTAFHGIPAQQRAIREQTRKMCEQTYRSLQNFTMLCVYFPHDPSIKIGHPYMDVRSHLWTGGAPLVCNGTAIGHTASAKDRNNMAEFKQDFYVINTYVRAWSWLVTIRQQFGPPG
uniref:Carbamoyl-phosphate synthase arginine-specific small chain n=1 Tax=Lygus hesperus TaxID=30085 RepID=A0A0A9XF26_LYGHE